MPKYLAEISGTAVEYGFGGNTPYDVNEIFKFEADNEELAKERANEYLSKRRVSLLCPKISLENLVEIEDINID